MRCLSHTQQDCLNTLTVASCGFWSQLTWLWNVGHCWLCLQVFAIPCCWICPAPRRASSPLAPWSGWSSWTGPKSPTWQQTRNVYHQRFFSKSAGAGVTVDIDTEQVYFLEEYMKVILTHLLLCDCSVTALPPGFPPELPLPKSIYASR